MACGDDPPSLVDAQLVTARSYGFASWATLKEYLGEIEPFVWNEPKASPQSAADLFPRVACLTYGRFRVNQREADRLFIANPDLAATRLALAAAIGDVEQVNRHLASHTGEMAVLIHHSAAAFSSLS